MAARYAFSDFFNGKFFSILGKWGGLVFGKYGKFHIIFLNASLNILKHADIVFYFSFLQTKETKWDIDVSLYSLRSELCDEHRHCVPLVYGQEYFFTRYPLEKTKFWNIIYLLTPEAWMWTFLTIFTIVLVLYLARTLSVKMGLSGDSTEEIILFPFRFLKFPSLAQGPG